MTIRVYPYGFYRFTLMGSEDRLDAQTVSQIAEANEMSAADFAMFYMEQELDLHYKTFKVKRVRKFN